MRLAEFIRQRREAIIADWETFAATLRPASPELTHRELGEHVGELLDAAAEDLNSRQSREEQREKSRGRGVARRMAQVAQRHALRRLEAGFRLDHVLAEYRALRASVVRLWEDSSPRPSIATRRDLTRFHEAIDEALTESINQYAAQVDRRRDEFLAVLGHDLRNPLAAISMSAAVLSESKDAGEAHVAHRILRASGRIVRLVNDLLDLTRTRLGEGIAITQQTRDLGALCVEAIDELKDAHPDRRIILERAGNLQGHWDGDRLTQVISNLVSNALEHGDATQPVTVRAASGGGRATLTVHNHGKAIPAKSLKTIFEPMVRASDGPEPAGPAGHLGLGLFIVRELVAAHGGTVSVTSTDAAGTTFTVSLPQTPGTGRRPPDAPRASWPPSRAEGLGKASSAEPR